MLLLLHWINRRHYINRTWHWIDCRHRRGRRRPGEYLCYQQVSRHKCAMAIMMNKWWWRREKRLSIMEFKNGSELARASSLCRAQMILLPQLFLLACKLSPDDIAMHASASSCPAAILLGYLLLRIKPKLYFEFGIFEIWHFNLALLQVSNMWHSIWWWNLRRHLTLHSREKSYRYKQGDLKRRMFSTFSTRLRRFLCVCVSTCVCQMETKIGTQAGGISSSAEYRRSIWKDEYLGTIWKDSNTTHLWKVNTCWRPHVAPPFNHIPWNIESKRGLAVLFALGFGLAIRVLSQVDARGLSAGTEYILQLCPSSPLCSHYIWFQWTQNTMLHAHVCTVCTDRACVA